MPDLHSALLIAVCAAVTACLRFLPFWLFGKDRPAPAAVLRLGRILPCAVIGMLVTYCLKDVHFSAAAGFLPQIIAGAVVVLLYVWKKNTLLSVVAGTAAYMILIQNFFTA